MVGGPCGYHGPYTFFKGVLISPVSSVTAGCTTSSGNNAINSTKSVMQSGIKQSTRKSANDLQRRGDDIGRNDFGR